MGVFMVFHGIVYALAGIRMVLALLFCSAFVILLIAMYVVTFLVAKKSEYPNEILGDTDTSVSTSMSITYPLISKV